MKSIQPEELSGYLDGELAPERRREVERALASDAELREQYESLQALDAQCREVATDTQFVPVVSMPSQRTVSKRWLAGPVTVVAFLVALRLTPKLIDAEFAGWIVANAVVLTVLLASVAWTLKKEASTDTYTNAVLQ
jgi:anti-sigma factor RsiW